eukprot:CAMPEP_0181288966 /NCGR_PEP_ID=MMETSP1101-20121128/630_1 /TAXON_ID=46948 /ORGANISM="Rhodomonas abbreviata, Strain Caron Lab Isolate" /LENGTH=496 /DNA_ID=CAMNT_0023393155 /DNA_START=94 /DNA_END=1580 /DNA_ORIENTATION=+
MATVEQLDALEASLTAQINALTTTISGNSRDMDIAWLILCGALVFFMQAGFAMLEAGIVHPKNVTNILFKNIMDASIAAICFWLLGYAFAYGKTRGGFIGDSNYAIEDYHNGSGDGGSDGWEQWFFQWAFAGAAATIVAGAVCERTKLIAYFIYAAMLTTFIYPIVVHWGWGSGWLSAWGANPDSDGNPRPIFQYDGDSNGMIDFAGSGIVHMVGGFSGLMGAIIVGPRLGRFDPGTGRPVELWHGNTTLQSLGVLILWFGWYGFNCGSTLAISGGSAILAGKVAVNTTISAAAGCITATVLSALFEGHFDLTLGLNGVLAGLVGITAPCAVVNPWMAFLIGFGAAIILYLGHHLLFVLRIDDPCDASVVHGFCGMWGLWCVGIFCTDKNVQYAGYPNVNDACGRGEQFAVQVVSSLVIAAWTVATAGLVFVLINIVVGMRVSPSVEEIGLDASEHGAFVDEPPAGFLSPSPDDVNHGQQQQVPNSYVQPAVPPQS